MAGPVLGAAALTNAVAIGTAIYNDQKGFSARHDNSHDNQKLLIQTLAEKSLKALKDGDIAQEEYDELLMLRDKYVFFDSSFAT